MTQKSSSRPEKEKSSDVHDFEKRPVIFPSIHSFVGSGETLSLPFETIGGQFGPKLTISDNKAVNGGKPLITGCLIDRL